MKIVSPENIVEKAADKLICESCGAKFSCGAKIGDCWCFAVEPEPETLTALREKFKNCLCGNCLTDSRQPENIGI